MTVPSQIGENSRLFALLFEAPQCALTVLVLVDDDLRHTPEKAAVLKRALDRIG
jgi:hypothetical protein